MALYVNGKQISGGGGGGNTNSVELTYAEYQALTPEQQLDGTEYFITDVNGDGQDFQPVCYSEEERVIGVWTDGKPLYQKTVTFENPSGRQDGVPHGIANVDYIFIENWHALRLAYNETIQGFEGSDTTWWASVFNVTPTGVSWRIGPGWACNFVVITFRYTKTTDTAGSGTWTPQGVPAHHYSTDEQVVGTWVDGSTIYEKTYNTNLVLSYGDWLVVDSTQTNIQLISAQTVCGTTLESQISTMADATYGLRVLLQINKSRTLTNLTIQYTKSST